MENDQKEYNILVFIGGCGIESVKLYSNSLSLQDSLLFYTGTNEGNICKKNVFFVSPSPDQLINSAMKFLLYYYKSRIALIYDNNKSKESQNEMIKNTIKDLDIEVVSELEVDLSEVDDNMINSKIGEFIYNLDYYSGRRFGSVANIYVICNLGPDKLGYFLYNFALKGYLTFIFDNSFTYYKYSVNYFLISDIINLNNQKIISYIYSVFGNDYILNGLELKYLLPLFLLSESVKDTAVLSNFDLTVRQLYSDGGFNTLFGKLVVTQDNVISHPISISSYNENGVLTHNMVLLEQSNEANVYIESILPKRLYSCNWKSSSSEKYSRTVINIGILLSLSGSYANQDVPMLLSYLLICKLINEKYNGIRGYMILPIIKDINSDINKVIPILDEFKEEEMSYIFGLSNSEMRNKIKDKLSEYKMILFYPHDYEGLECKENIVYVGIPFTSRSLIKYYIEGDYLETNYRILILYSDAEYCIKSKDILVSDLEAMNVKVLKSIRIMKNAVNFQPTAEQIYTYLTSNGIIIIMMENGEMNLIAKALYENNIVRPNYRIYYIGVDYNLMLLPSFYGYFMNQLIVTTKRGIKGTELDDMIVEYYKELYPYLTSNYYLSNNMYYSIISVLSWKSIIENKKSFLYENFINSISGVIVDTPLGRLKINENHIISIPSLIMTVQGNVYTGPEYKILYDSSNGLSPDPYSSYLVNENKKIYKCSFSSSMNSEKYQVVQFPIFLLLSQKSEIHFYQILLSSAAIVDEINLNVETTKRGRYLNLLFIFYNDNDNKLKNILKSRINELELGIRNDNLNFLMVGCTTEYCRNIAIPMTNEYNSLLIVPGRYIGEKCYKNVFYTGPIINQVIDTTISYIENTNKQNIVIINTPNEKWDKFYEVFVNSISSSMRIIQNFNISETQRFSMETVKQLISSFDYNGGIIMSFLSKKPFFSLLETLEKLNPDESKYFIFSMTVYADEVMKKYNRIPYQFYYVSSVDSAVKTSDIIQRDENRLLRFIGFSKTTDDGISIAIGINAIINAMSYAGSLNVLMIKQYLYNLYLNADQTTWFDKSNYLVRDMYVYKYNKDGIEVVKTVQRSIPKTFDWNIAENYGKICDTTLLYDNYDVKNENKNNENENVIERRNMQSIEDGGATSKTEIIHIILVTSNSGMYYSDYVGVSETFKEAVIQINNNGGINNKKQIDYLIIDDGSDSNICFNKLNEALSNDEYDVIFSTSNSMCLEMILPRLNEKNIKLFHIGIFGGESCEKNIIHIGLEPTSMEIYILRLLNQGLKYFAIIGTSESNSIKFATYAERYIDYLKGSVTYSVNLDENIMSLNTIAKNIKTMLPSGNSILYFGNARIHLLLSESLIDLGVKTDEYIFYSFSTGEEVIYSAKLSDKMSKLLPFYSIRHYFNSIEIASNIQFKNILRYPLPSGLEVNGYHESIYSSLLFWSETINRYYYLISGKEKESIREIGIEYFYKNKYESPIGEWELATNNIIERLTYVGYYDNNENGEMIIKEIDDNGRPKAWKKFINSGLYKCVLNDTRIGSKYKQPSNKIEIIASLNGRDELRGREVVSAILYAIDEINKNENGLIGNQIEVDIINSDSDINKLDSISKETSALTGVNAIFGGLWDKEYNIMIPYFNKAKKLLFFLGIAKGENCNSYGIVSQADLNQLIYASRSTLLSYSKSFCIIYNDKDEFSNESKELFSRYLDLLKREYDLYIFNGDNNNEEISKIGVDHSRGGGCVIIDLVNNELSLLLSESLFSLSLSSVNFVYVHYFVDAYDTKGNEKYFENHLFFGSWFIAVGTGSERKYQKANEFYNNMRKRYGSYFKLVQSTEAAYTSVKLWETGVRESYSFDPNSVRKGMIGVKKEIGSSFIELMPNNYISRPFYGAQIVNGKVVIIASPSGLLDPNPFSSFIKENGGKECDFISKGGIYIKPNIIHLLLILEKDYYIEEEIMNAYFGFDYSVESTNSVGGINGYYIVYDCLIIKTNEIENKTMEYASRIDENKDENSLYYVGIFGCLGSECRNIVSKISEEKRLIYFYFGESEGEYFSKYTVTVGNTLIQKVIVAADYLKDRYKNFFILIDKENEYPFFFLLLPSFFSLLLFCIFL